MVKTAYLGKKTGEISSLENSHIVLEIQQKRLKADDTTLIGKRSYRLAMLTDFL